jgi:hypothetical protein
VLEMVALELHHLYLEHKFNMLAAAVVVIGALVVVAQTIKTVTV